MAQENDEEGRRPDESAEEYIIRRQLNAVDKALKNAPITLKPGEANISDSEQAPVAEEVQDIPIELPEEAPGTTDSQLAQMLSEEDKRDTVRLSKKDLAKKKRENEDTVVLPKKTVVDLKPDLSGLIESGKARYDAGEGVTDRFVGTHSTAYAVFAIGEKQSYSGKQRFELKKGDYLIAQILEIIVDGKSFNLVKPFDSEGKKILIGCWISPYRVDSVGGKLTAVRPSDEGFQHFQYFDTLEDMLIKNSEIKKRFTDEQRKELFCVLQLYKWVSRDNEEEIKILLGQDDTKPRQTQQEASYQPAENTGSLEEWNDFQKTIKEIIVPSQPKSPKPARDSTRTMRKGNRLPFE
jgi:hypothetical protein